MCRCFEVWCWFLRFRPGERWVDPSRISIFQLNPGVLLRILWNSPRNSRDTTPFPGLPPLCMTSGNIFGIFAGRLQSFLPIPHLSFGYIPHIEWHVMCLVQCHYPVTWFQVRRNGDMTETKFHSGTSWLPVPGRRLLQSLRQNAYIAPALRAATNWTDRWSLSERTVSHWSAKVRD